MKKLEVVSEHLRNGELLKPNFSKLLIYLKITARFAETSPVAAAKVQ
jgi:hypothetical protein